MGTRFQLGALIGLLAIVFLAVGLKTRNRNRPQTPKPGQVLVDLACALILGVLFVSGGWPARAPGLGLGAAGGAVLWFLSRSALAIGQLLGGQGAARASAAQRSGPSDGSSGTEAGAWPRDAPAWFNQLAHNVGVFIAVPLFVICIEALLRGKPLLQELEKLANWAAAAAVYYIGGGVRFLIQRGRRQRARAGLEAGASGRRP